MQHLQRGVFGSPLNNAWSLTHWGRVTHICVGNLTIIGSENCLSTGRRQAITWTNVGILLLGPLGTNFSEMLIHSRKSIVWKMAVILCRPQCVKSLNSFVSTTLWIHFSSVLPKFVYVTDKISRSIYYYHRLIYHSRWYVSIAPRNNHRGLSFPSQDLFYKPDFI